MSMATAWNAFLNNIFSKSLGQLLLGRIIGLPKLFINRHQHDR